MWGTILVAIATGSIAGAFATIWAARAAVRHDTRMRLHELTATAYTDALAAMEEVFHVVNSVYSDPRLRCGPGDEMVEENALDTARKKTDAVQAKASAQQAPAKLLASPPVEQDISEFNDVLASKLISGITTGQGPAVLREMNDIHDRLLLNMRVHLNQLRGKDDL